MIHIQISSILGQAVSVSLPIRIGLSIQNLTEQFRSANEIETIVMQFEKNNEKFLIAENKRFVGIYLHSDARPLDVLKAYFYAVSFLQDRSQLQDRNWEVQTKWNDFVALAQREGWQTASHLIFVDEYRLEWRI